jgi:CheY-like chemotaxis protein
MKKILITEDFKILRDALEFYLQGEGFEVKSVNNGISSYLRSNIWKPDLIIMDICLPISNGLEVARELINTKIPIIFMTGSCDKSFREESEKCNSIGFLEKPFSLEKLKEIIFGYFDRVKT